MDPLAIVALCLALAGAETLHGIARTWWVVPRLGKERARQLSVFTGTALAYAIGAAMVPRVGLMGDGPHLALGLGLAAFMAAFDLALVRWVMRRPWRQALQDLNPASGNWLLFGLIALSAMPWLVSRWVG